MNQAASKISFVGKLRARLQRAALRIAPGGPVDDGVLEDLESQLLQSDVGMDASRTIMEELRDRTRTERIHNAAELRSALQEILKEILKPVAHPLVIDSNHKPFVILAVGVNGVGKTTTIGKLTQRFKSANLSVMLAAGDTFRAAAVEQLQTWGERLNVPVIAQADGADPAAVIHDAWQAAKSRGSHVLIADTAGRLHTQGNLMDELKKIRRVLARLDSSSPHECLLVLDAGTGQNALRQIEQFHAAVTLSGLALTKLDGTAKGGILVATAQRFGIPIRYIGIGEQPEDLEEFDADAFASALMGTAEGASS